MRLDFDSLLIERSRLRNKYGAAFMTDYPGDVRSHRQRFELYGLSPRHLKRNSPMMRASILAREDAAKDEYAA